jgi:hypothetical protein
VKGKGGTEIRKMLKINLIGREIRLIRNEMEREHNRITEITTIDLTFKVLLLLLYSYFNVIANLVGRNKI